MGTETKKRFSTLDRDAAEQFKINLSDGLDSNKIYHKLSNTWFKDSWITQPFNNHLDSVIVNQEITPDRLITNENDHFRKQKDFMQNLREQQQQMIDEEKAPKQYSEHPDIFAPGFDAEKILWDKGALEEYFPDGFDLKMAASDLNCYCQRTAQQMKISTKMENISTLNQICKSEATIDGVTLTGAGRTKKEA